MKVGPRSLLHIMVKEPDQYGWMMFHAPDVKQVCTHVVTLVMAFITVDIMKMLVFSAPEGQCNLI